MPNGISCAYFAARNHIYGQKEKNMFKEGIAGAQTARAIDTVAKTGFIKGPLASPVISIFDKAAAVARKIVYPLIIASGVYNTAIAEDKVKTGASQASGIATMYAFEQVAENGLKKINNKLANTNIVKNNKAARIALYAAKGLTFVAASLSGYNLGSRSAEKIVDKARDKKQEINLEKENIFSNTNNVEDELFKEMKML